MTLVLSGKTRTPASRGSCQCLGNGLPGGRVCTPLQSAKLTHQSGKCSRESVRTKPVDAMAERAFHAIRAFRFRQGVQPIGLTSYERRRVN